MNKVFLVGRLVADPEPFTTKTGINQTRITIATRDNVNKQESYFFPCIAWRNQANFINTYLKKGDLVAIDGKLTRRSYTNKQGVIVYITEIVIDAINSIGSKKDANSGLTIPTTTTNKTEPTKSIDESFPERVVKQSNDLEQPKPEAVKYDETQSTEWYDEINKE